MRAQVPGEPADGSFKPGASGALSSTDAAGVEDSWKIIVITISAGSALILIGVAMVDVVGRCIRSGWSAKLVLRGAVTAPPPSPSLTLLLSDIEVGAGS
jgi:hypothetical protein